MKYNEEHRRLASARVITTAQAILSGELSIVAGARQLVGLRFEVDAEHDPDFVFLVGLDSQTDHLPIGDVRARWNSEILKTKDNELHAFEVKVRDKTFQACEGLIRKYQLRS